MISPLKFILIGAICLEAMAGNARATLLTFDSLSAGAPLVVNPPAVPNGYGGLNWANFAVENGTLFSPSTGYYNGVVSANNVAFNPFGNPAAISVSSGLFYLGSAYLTLALNLSSPLTIQVKGYDGASLVYDDSFTVYSSAPTLINFDHAGVDSVTFISSPSQQFAMDNLTASVPDQGNTLLMFALANAGLLVMTRKMRKQST